MFFSFVYELIRLDLLPAGKVLFKLAAIITDALRVKTDALQGIGQDAACAPLWLIGLIFCIHRLHLFVVYTAKPI